MRKAIFIFLAATLLINSFTPALAVIIPSHPVSSSLSSEPDPARVKAAVEELKGLSKKEKRERVKAAKKELKAFNAAKQAGQEPSTNTLLLVILAILLPPLAVYLHQGEINNKFWISLILTLLFWLPGVIYALIVILGDGD
jgi:uncharacterized membrane protein YqaE (UPF0057 family)